MDDVDMRDQKWDGYSNGKTIPSLQAYPQKITRKNGRHLFCEGFPKEKGKKFFLEFLHSIFLFFFLFSLPFFSICFYKKWRAFIGEC